MEKHKTISIILSCGGILLSVPVITSLFNLTTSVIGLTATIGTALFAIVAVTHAHSVLFKYQRKDSLSEDSGEVRIKRSGDE